MESIQFAILSDTHINLPHPLAKRTRQLRKALKQIQEQAQIDAICVCGDVSDHGLCSQLESFAYLIDTFRRNSKKEVFVVLGNHDLNHYLPMHMNVLDTVNEMRCGCGFARCESVYEERFLGSTPMLMLNSEARLQTTSYLSDQQLSWLDQRLQAHKEKEAVILLHHQPLTYTHMGSAKYGLGEQDGKLKSCLKKYHNVIFISGHIHNDPTTIKPVITRYGILVDVPSFQLTRWHGGHTGCGLLMRFENHRLEIQIYDFVRTIGYRKYHIDMHTKTMVCEDDGMVDPKLSFAYKNL